MIIVEELTRDVIGRTVADLLKTVNSRGRSPGPIPLIPRMSRFEAISPLDRHFQSRPMPKKTLNLDPGQLHELRERAIGRMHLAWVAAAASGGVSLFLTAWTMVSADAWLVSLPYLAGALAVIGLGWVTYHERSVLAAGTLVVLAGGTLLARWIETRTPSGALVGIVVLILYVQGLRGAMDFAELKDASSTGASE